MDSTYPHLSLDEVVAAVPSWVSEQRRRSDAVYSFISLLLCTPVLELREEMSFFACWAPLLTTRGASCYSRLASCSVGQKVASKNGTSSGHFWGTKNRIS